MVTASMTWRGATYENVEGATGIEGGRLHENVNVAADTTEASMTTHSLICDLVSHQGDGCDACSDSEASERGQAA